MKKYSKKPLSIDAIQWNNHGDFPGVHVLNVDLFQKAIPTGQKELNNLSTVGMIDTPHGTLLVYSGDWIVYDGLDITVIPDSKFQEMYEEKK